MSRRLVNEVKDHFESKSTNELLEIWQQNDRDAYSESAFEAIRQILSERNVTVPVQPAFVPKPPAEPQWDIHEIKKKRLLYLICFVLHFIGYIIMILFGLSGEAVGGYITVIFGIAFLFFFLTSAKKVFGYGIGDLVLIGIGLLMPFLGALVLAIMDGRIYQAIKRKEYPDKPQFCSLVIYSLILFLLPVIGLPLAIISIRKISKSNGLLYGKTLAWISLVLNALSLLPLLLGIVIPFIAKYVGH